MRQTLLSTYLGQRKLSQAQFARDTSIPQPMVSLFSRGLRRPGLKYALIIEQATSGAVPASYWADFKVTKPTTKH